MFARQYPVVVFFVQHIAYYRGLHSKFAEVAAHRDFWRSTCDAHLKLATVSWCNVFGSYNEDLHWMKTPAAEIADQAAQDFSPEDLGSYRLHLRDMAGLPQEHARLPQHVCGASRYPYALLPTRSRLRSGDPDGICVSGVGEGTHQTSVAESAGAQRTVRWVGREACSVSGLS
jgi:hypothetical protein